MQESMQREDLWWVPWRQQANPAWWPIEPCHKKALKNKNRRVQIAMSLLRILITQTVRSMSRQFQAMVQRSIDHTRRHQQSLKTLACGGILIFIPLLLKMHSQQFHRSHQSLQIHGQTFTMGHLVIILQPPTPANLVVKTTLKFLQFPLVPIVNEVLQNLIQVPIPPSVTMAPLPP